MNLLLPFKKNCGRSLLLPLKFTFPHSGLFVIDLAQGLYNSDNHYCLVSIRVINFICIINGGSV